MTSTRGPGQHRDPGQHPDPVGSTTPKKPSKQSKQSRPAQPMPSIQRPVPGTIAILPQATEVFVEAIVAAGGEVAQLDEHTCGLVWLGGSAAELAETLRQHPGIGWVQLPLAGVEDMAPVFATHPHSPLFTSAKGAYAEPVAEHAVALTLALLRQIPEKARSTSWARPREGISLYGRNVTIIGAGGIAVEIMRLLAPFEVRITIVRESRATLHGAERTVTSDRLSHVLGEADVVIVAAAATDSTAGLLGAAEFALMKPSAVLVNVARGSLVDQVALAAALSAGELWGAGLDVTSPEPLPDGHPLWRAPRCVITSHSADTDEMVEPLLVGRVRANAAAFLGNGEFVGLVDTAKGY